MFDTLGAPEIILIALWLLVPIGILFWVAGSRGRSRLFSLFGLLGWLGLVIGLLFILAIPRPRDL